MTIFKKFCTSEKRFNGIKKISMLSNSQRINISNKFNRFSNYSRNSNSQVLAMKYSQEKPELQTEIIESINEMLHEIQKLNENP